MRRSTQNKEKLHSRFNIFQIVALFFVLSFCFGIFIQLFFLGTSTTTSKNFQSSVSLRRENAAIESPENDLKGVNINEETTIQSVDIGKSNTVYKEELDTQSSSIENTKFSLGMFGSGGERDIPNIVKAWREAKLDWHQLLPKHNSIWERFGTPSGEGKFPLLVNKEKQATDYLTRFQESGLATKYGKDHGPLLNYSGCNVFSDACMIHDESSCRNNQLCHWDSAALLCFDGPDASIPQEAKCTSPTDANGPVRDISHCKVWVDQPTVFISIDSESQTMFYHWWASWTSIRQHWTRDLSEKRHTHYIISEITDPMFFTYFGLISDHCWRRRQKQIPPNTCFCNVKNFMATQARSDASSSVTQMMKYLQLDHITPPSNHVKIGLVSRRRKRFILNEYALVDAVVAMGYECELLPLETMTIYEQLKALRSLDVLIGIHGSALDNSVFLAKGSVMVQLLPYKVEHRVTFAASAVEAGMVYMEWQLKDK